MVFILVLSMVIFTGIACREDTGPANADSADSSVQTPLASSLPTADINLAGENFTVELAFTDRTRRKGLMFRSHLPDHTGMLFIFADSRQRSFYMKNCLIDLDILFITADGTIATVTTMTVPTPGKPLKYYPSGVPTKYALELPAGTAARLKLKVAQKIELPPRIRNITPKPD